MTVQQQLAMYAVADAAAQAAAEANADPISAAVEAFRLASERYAACWIESEQMPQYFDRAASQAAKTQETLIEANAALESAIAAYDTATDSRAAAQKIRGAKFDQVTAAVTAAAYAAAKTAAAPII